MGRSTRWLARERGAEYEREIIHRDYLVVLATEEALTRSSRSTSG